MDTNGYPDDQELPKIQEWDYKDLLGLMEYVKELWRYADSGYWKRGRKYYRLSTGGWSGNESIIGALQANIMFWSVYWVSSKRGGHYIFEIRKVKDDKETQNKE